MRTVLLVSLCASLLCAAELKRPRITGLAHVAFYVEDLAKARAFYRDLLGFSEPWSLNNPDGTVWLTFIKINDRQYLELFPQAAPPADRLSHFAVETSDIEGMRAYLSSRGVQVPPAPGKGRTGTLNFTVKDPDGHSLEFVQYPAACWAMRDRGKFLSRERVSRRMTHAGILVGALEPALKFYRDVLGFQETWRGGHEGKPLSWVNLRVPDGEDYIEFMLYGELPEPARRGTAHHICLDTPDMDQTVAALESRPARRGYPRPIEIRTGLNRRRQANLFDPDGTRVELMEPHTVDGKPAPSSTAPPPR